MSRTETITSVGYTGPVGRECVTPPVGPLLRIEDVRARLRLPFADEDVQLQDFLEGAVGDIEAQLGRVLLPQTWRWWYDGLTGCEIVLPEPARAIVALTTYAADGTPTVVAPASYALDQHRHRVLVTGATSGGGRLHNGVSLEVEVGYATAMAVAPAILQAVYLSIQGLYLRGADPAAEAQARADAITRLLAPYRFRMGVA